MPSSAIYASESGPRAREDTVRGGLPASTGEAQVQCLDKTSPSLCSRPVEAARQTCVSVQGSGFPSSIFYSTETNPIAANEGYYFWLGCSAVLICRSWEAGSLCWVPSILYHGRPGATKRKCSEMLDISKCKCLLPHARMGKRACDNELGEGWECYWV